MYTMPIIITILIGISIATYPLWLHLIDDEKFYKPINTEQIILEYCATNDKHISNDYLKLLIHQANVDKDWHFLVYCIDKYKTRDNLLNFVKNNKIDTDQKTLILYFIIAGNFIIINKDEMYSLLYNYASDLIYYYNRSLDAYGIEYGITELNKNILGYHTISDIELAKKIIKDGKKSKVTSNIRQHLIKDGVDISSWGRD